MTTRVRDWQSRLQACLAERWAMPFKWGEQDCALFAADCVVACTGVDLAARFRGLYADAAGAARLLAKLGGLAALAASRLGPQIEPAMAQTGDVVLVVNEGRDCLAVSTGAGSWLAPGQNGVTVLTGEPVKAWRISWTEV